MNNKGQSLVLFVLIVPIIILIVVSVYEIGRMALLKQELDNINYLTIDYGLDHLTDENIESKLHDIIVKNKADIENIELVLGENNISLTITKKIASIDIKSSYTGYLDVDKKIIEKNK